MLHGNLSSGFTGVYKYVFLPVWSAIFGWGTYHVFKDPESVVFNGVIGGAPQGIEWVLLALWLVGTFCFTWMAARLRWLRAYDSKLIAGHFGREVSIGFDRVVEVTELLFVRPLMIRIVFKGADHQLHTIWFMPEFSWPSGEVNQRTIAELRSLASHGREPAV